MSEKDLCWISFGIGTFSFAFYLLMSLFEDEFVKIAFYLLLIFLVILIGGSILMYLYLNKISKLLSVIGVIGIILSVFGMAKLLSFFTLITFVMLSIAWIIALIALFFCTPKH